MRSFAAGLLVLSLTSCVEAHETQLVDAGASGAVDAREAMQQLRSGLSRFSDGLVVEKRADGIWRVKLNRRFQSAWVMTPEGRAMCVDSTATLDGLIGARP